MAVTSITVTFDPDASEITFDFVGVYASGVEWFIGIEGPYGDIQALSVVTGSPDVDGQTGQAVISSSDPLDAGDYALTVVVWDKAEVESVRIAQQTLTYDFCYEDEGTMTLAVSDDCQNLSIQDTTTYPTSTSFTRAITVAYPVITGIVTPDDLSFTSDDILQSMVQPDGKIYENVTWPVSGSASGDFQETSGVWTINYPRTYPIVAVNHEVQCDLDLCAAVGAVDEYWQKVQEKACQMGGVCNLPSGVQSNLKELTMNLSLYAHYINCGDRINAQRFYNEIVRITGSTCSNTTTPRVIQAATVNAYGWIPVETSDLSGTFTSTSLNLRVINDVIYFKGLFAGGSTWEDLGEEFLPKSYFDDLGVSLTNANSVLVYSTADAADPRIVGRLYPSGGALILQRLDSGYTPSGSFRIVSPLAL